MRIIKAEFIKSATRASQYPSFGYHEIAVIGRSNAGKSSLINMITGRKSLVKTGARPGVTQTVNFFVINDNVSIADLPGYGYAKIGRSVRDAFMPQIAEYLKSREALVLAFLLIDIRREPEEVEKHIISSILKRNTQVYLIATKCDKVSRGECSKNVICMANALNIGRESIIPTSSKNGQGKKELLAIISSASRFNTEKGQRPDFSA